MALRVLALAALAGGMCLALAAGAAGVPPVHEPAEPVAPEFHGPGEVCAFALTATPLVERGRTTAFFDQEGNLTRIHFAGSLVMRFTNDSPGGKSIDLNVSGPGDLLFAENGNVIIDGHGRNSVLLFPGDIGPNGQTGPGGLLLSGHVQAHFTPTGQLVVDSFTGHSQDLCALLA